MPVEPPEYKGTERLVWTGSGSGVGDLVVRFDPDSSTSCSFWEPTFEERGALLDGARVILRVIGRHPPLAISVEGVPS